MIKLNFKEYQGKLIDEKLVSRPTEHYYEDSNMILLLFKSREKWEYYTSVLKREILEFSGMLDMELEEAIDMFKINYCSNGLPIEDIREIPFEDEIDIFEEIAYYEEEPEEFITEKNVELDAGEDMIIEAKDYSDFLFKTFNRFEKNVLNAVNKIQIEKRYINKNFGDFLKNMFNTINTVLFSKEVKRYIKIDLMTGLSSAEKELDMDIGFTDTYQDKLNQLHAQQIDGYTINGKKWFGIKGVTKELQSDIIIIVQNGIKDKKSIKDIKADISNKFDKFSDWRSELIARTETNRIINESKLLGYKESGLEGEKIVIVALDNRTSPICKRLHKRYSENSIGLDEDFIDPETNKAYRTPPFHGNCRTTIAFIPN